MKTKEIRRKIILIMVIIMMVIGLNITSNAATESSFSITVSPASKTVEPGDEIVITLGVSNINMGEYGMNTLEGVIEYDNEIFETLKATNIESKNNWATTYNDESSLLNGKFLSANLTSGVKESTTIFTVKLKVKSTVKETKTTKVTFKDVTSNDGTNLVNTGNKSVNVTVNVKQEEPAPANNTINNLVGNTVSNTINNTINNTVNNTVNNVTNNAGNNAPSSNTENTKVNTNAGSANVTNNTNSNIPYTGKEENILMAIGVVIVIAIILWRRNVYYKEI